MWGGGGNYRIVFNANEKHKCGIHSRKQKRREALTHGVRARNKIVKATSSTTLFIQSVLLYFGTQLHTS